MQGKELRSGSMEVHQWVPGTELKWSFMMRPVLQNMFGNIPKRGQSTNGP